MPSQDFHRSRRKFLLDALESPVLLFAGGDRARNYAANVLPFRAESNFLYLFDHPEPNAAALLDPQTGETHLFLEARTAADAVWHGARPSLEEERDRHGVDHCHPLEDLRSVVSRVGNGRSLASFATADERTNALARELTGLPLDFFDEERIGTPELIDTLAALRMQKTEEEIEVMRGTAQVTKAAHEAAMRHTKAGGHEKDLAGRVQGTMAQYGCCEAYGSILSVRGEVLHNHHHDNELRTGDLVLLDAGAEAQSGYCSDVTRTWPVDGKFSAEQAEIYDIVLSAQLASIEAARPGVRFLDVHLASARVICDGLVQMGLLRGSVDSLLEAGSHAVFFPHGVGHMIGLDVHDMESFGDRVHYPNGRPRSSAFGTAFLRMDRDLQDGSVFTVEPGIYFVPAIFGDDEICGPHRDSIDMPRVLRFLEANDGRGFGGIRIEDDVVCTADRTEVLTADIPKERDAIEAIVGADA
ncbi:MAG: aminopeptidase P family protein [Planctomycetota bacterium]